MVIKSSEVLVFGDVHGGADQLAVLIQAAKALSSSGGDLDIISCGDLVDRGPDSRRVLDLCVEHHVMLVHGNHDLWFKGVCDGEPMLESFVLGDVMGGLATVLSYGVRVDTRYKLSYPTLNADLMSRIPQAHKALMRSSVTAIDLTVGDRRFLVSHAGMPASDAHNFIKPGVTPLQAYHSFAARNPGTAFWGDRRVHPGDADVARFDGYTQVFGHKPVRKPVLVDDHYYALDTGCPGFMSGMLSGVFLSGSGGRVTLSVTPDLQVLTS